MGVVWPAIDEVLRRNVAVKEIIWPRIRGEPATPAADMWSLGATLYAAVEGRHPFDRQGASALLTAIVSGLPDPPTRAGPLWLVISGLLRKNPAKRLDAAEAARLLRQVAGAASAAPGAPLAEATLPLPAADRPAASTVVIGRPDRPRETAPAGEEAHRAAGPAGALREGALIPGLEPRPLLRRMCLTVPRLGRIL
jgi:serine/threonine protein kinase